MEGGINLQGLRKCLHWCHVPYSAYICDECTYREHGLYDCVEQAMRDADKLLEKLEPMKPIVKAVEFECDIFSEMENKVYCPTCGMEFIVRVNFCPQCGQAIKREM